MTNISLCRPVPALPEAITRDLLIVQMLTLEQHLRSTHPIFEENLYMGLLDKLAVIYYQVNHFPVGRRMVIESSIRPEWVAPERKYQRVIINQL